VLPRNSHLELERGEDIDTVQDRSLEAGKAEKRLLEQLKVRDSRALTPRSPDALQSLANHSRHRPNNPEVDLQFRYITTAEISVERGWSQEEGAVDTWMALRRGAFGESERNEAVAVIQKLLLT
jgi:hypothetical protein